MNINFLKQSFVSNSTQEFLRNYKIIHFLYGIFLFLILAFNLNDPSTHIISPFSAHWMCFVLFLSSPWSFVKTKTGIRFIFLSFLLLHLIDALALNETAKLFNFSRPHATNWDFFKHEQTSIYKSFDGLFKETVFCCEERIHNNFRWMVKIIENSTIQRSSHFKKSFSFCLNWNILSSLMRSAVVEDGLDDAREACDTRAFPRWISVTIPWSRNLVWCCWKKFIRH